MCASVHVGMFVVKSRVDCCVRSGCVKDHKRNHSRGRSPMDDR